MIKYAFKIHYHKPIRGGGAGVGYGARNIIQLKISNFNLSYINNQWLIPESLI
jgi:hypothetical protein